MSLETLRIEIDEINQNLVKLLENRFRIVEEVGKEKKKNNIQVFDKNREILILKSMRKLVEDKTYGVSVEKTFLKLMDIAKDYQRKYFNKCVCVFSNSTKDISILAEDIAKHLELHYIDMRGHRNSSDVISAMRKGTLVLIDLDNFDDIALEKLLDTWNIYIYDDETNTSFRKKSVYEFVYDIKLFEYIIDNTLLDTLKEVLK